MVGGMRLVLAVIASAVAIAILIDTPRRELEEELKQQWQEYREHVENPSVSRDFQKSARFFSD